MLGLTEIKAAAAPYMLAIKAAIVAVVFLFGLGVGCSCQKKVDQKSYDSMVAKKNKALGEAADQLEADAKQLRVLVHTFDEIDAATEQARREGEQQLNHAKDAARTAEINARDARRRASAAQVELDKAMRDPDCRALLEKKSCAVFR